MTFHHFQWQNYYLFGVLVDECRKCLLSMKVFIGNTFLCFMKVFFEKCLVTFCFNLWKNSSFIYWSKSYFEVKIKMCFFKKKKKWVSWKNGSPWNKKLSAKDMWLCHSKVSWSMIFLAHRILSVYSSSLLRVIIACSHLPFFNIFSNVVHFCPNFSLPFFWKIAPMPCFLE